ncbi:hypothetical protein Rta_30240 [Ramlibacter tataouinensis TTB310]|uniref:Uncharacterized protein n=1 Tax=Ramlibacter tataouinensis (strain ATCC BAA-407 / DSM 14655 / LMG 21543 / TTB310) TaxID=365046 RepID=F5XW30_RAMTT|nr:hypothetical protein Rta_30240 [Ramlibacter tataouinensis TTB310]
MDRPTRDDAPLAGVKVVEFCSVAAGPFCSMLLADMGADVIKVEPHEGDALRQWPPLTEGYSENFASSNRNKRSIVLDERPDLVYCSISAFGQTGPRATEGGFNLTIQAASGLMSVTGEPGGAPVKCGVPVADFASGLYGALSIATLLARARTGGPGGHLDIPMFGCTLGIAALQVSEFFGTGRSRASSVQRIRAMHLTARSRRRTAISQSPLATRSCGWPSARW